MLPAISALVVFKVEQEHHAVLPALASQTAVPPAAVIAAEGAVKLTDEQ